MNSTVKKLMKITFDVISMLCTRQDWYEHASSFLWNFLLWTWHDESKNFFMLCDLYLHHGETTKATPLDSLALIYINNVVDKQNKGPFNIYVNKILTFFDHPSTPSKQIHWKKPVIWLINVNIWLTTHPPLLVYVNIECPLRWESGY